MSAVNHAAFFRFLGCCCFVSECCVAGMNGGDVTLSCGCRFHSYWLVCDRPTHTHTHTLLCQEQAWFINCWNPRWRVPTQSIESRATAWPALGSRDADMSWASKDTHKHTHLCSLQCCGVYCITVLMGNGSSPALAASCQSEARRVNFHHDCQGHHCCLVWQ